MQYSCQPAHVSYPTVTFGRDHIRARNCRHTSSMSFHASSIYFTPQARYQALEFICAGLLFGLFANSGKHTCAGFAGSEGFEEQDAKLFAEWGVDYLKYDNCDTQEHTGRCAPRCIQYDPLHQGASCLSLGDPFLLVMAFCKAYKHRSTLSALHICLHSCLRSSLL